MTCSLQEQGGIKAQPTSNHLYYLKEGNLQALVLREKDAG